MHNRLFRILITFTLLTGCARPQLPAGPAAATESTGLPPKAPEPPLFDGFEADALARFWLPGDYGTGLYVPGAIQISTNYARTGTRSARITVKEGDVEQKGDDGRSVERAELDSGHHPFLSRDVWYGFSFLLPPGFPVV